MAPTTLSIKGVGQAKLKDVDASLKVWIGGLPEGTMKEDLEAHFAQAGDVIVAEVMPRNTGCVAFSSAEEAQQAILILNGSAVGASIIQVDVWTQKPRQPKGAGKTAFPAFGGKGFGKSPMVQKPLFQKLAALGGAAYGYGQAAGYGQAVGFGAGQFGGKGKGFGKGKGKGFKANPLKGMDNSLKVWVNNVPELGGKWKTLEAHFEQVGKTSWVEIMGKGKACVAYKTAEEAAAALSLNGVLFEGVALEVDVWAKPTA